MTVTPSPPILGVFSVFLRFSRFYQHFFIYSSVLAKKKKKNKKEGKGVGQRGKGESNRNVSVLMGLQLPQALDVGLRLCRFCCLVLLPHSCLFPLSWRRGIAGADWVLSAFPGRHSPLPTPLAEFILHNDRPAIKLRARGQYRKIKTIAGLFKGAKLQAHPLQPLSYWPTIT